MIYHVVAMARNRVIGKDNKLPWHFSADLKRFKSLTTGQTVIMGRKTFESIGKPLPGRENFVLTRQPSAISFQKSENRTQETENNPRFFSSIEDALKNIKTQEAFIIGGAELYAQTLDKIDGIYLTQIDAEYDGDTFYPQIPSDFHEVSRSRIQDEPVLDVVYYKRSNLKP
ncbi:MAG: dihydrofolate reductase [Candidatus Omnitrophica bacterium]|nr:dihydrofolate reductase [Candidatus Omnitrophota bacterium]